MPDTIRFNLRYRGQEVDDGTMPIGLVSEALDGFSGAYRKTAAYFGPDSIPQLRVSAPKQGSFDLLVIAGVALSQDPANLASMAAHMWDFAENVFHIVTGVINLKKHTKGQPYNLHVKGDGNQITIINADKVELVIPPQVLEVFQAKLIDRDMDKLMAPLRPKRIETAEFVIEDKVETIVTSEERQYFRPDAQETTTKPDELIGTLVSLNKEHKRGSFKMTDGKTVPYHFVGNDEDKFLRLDFSYKGPVRATGTVEYDAEGKPIHIKITDVERLQAQFQFPEPSP